MVGAGCPANGSSWFRQAQVGGKAGSGRLGGRLTANGSVGAALAVPAFASRLACGRKVEQHFECCSIRQLTHLPPVSYAVWAAAGRRKCAARTKMQTFAGQIGT